MSVNTCWHVEISCREISKPKDIEKTQNAFKKILRNFRPDTPEWIVTDLFFYCINPRRNFRINFEKVNCLIFILFILK